MSKWRRRPELLLCPNIPPPLFGLAPRVILGGAWWRETRGEAVRRTNHRCTACGVHESKARGRGVLEGHEVYHTDYAAGRAVYLETVALCQYCYAYIHDGRIASEVGRGLMPHSTYRVIINHGNKVLHEAGLERPTLAERNADLRNMQAEDRYAPWGEWRLVLGGREYRPLWASPEEWERAHGYAEP